MFTSKQTGKKQVILQTVNSLKGQRTSTLVYNKK